MEIMDQLESEDPQPGSPDKCKTFLSQISKKNPQVQSQQIEFAEKELQIFYDSVSEAGDVWVEIVMEVGAINETDTHVIDFGKAVSKVYQWILKTVDHKIEKSIILDRLVSGKSSGCIQKYEVDFDKKNIDQSGMALLIEVLKKQGQIIVGVYQEHQRQIKEMICEIDEIIKRKEVLNSYILFAMLKQMISKTDSKIQKQLKNKFADMSRNKIKEFGKFIEKNCEILNLKVVDSEVQINKKIKKNDFESEEWTSLINDFNKEQQKFNKYTKNVLEEAILFKNKLNDWDRVTMESDSELKQESLHSIKIQISNCSDKKIPPKLSNKSIRMLGKNNSMNQICDTLESQIEFSGNTASYLLPTDQYATIGGNIGKCLADINQFRSASQFFLELSKTTALCATIGYAVTKIPILTYFILAGGFSYSYYLTLSNHFLSPFKKINQIGCTTMTALGTIGTTMSGIFIGQIVIPVPILGAFVGGVCGGYFGTKSIRKINNFLSKTYFRDIIMYLKKTILTDRHWLCTNNLIQKIGINEQHLDTLAKSQQQKDTLITAICFFIVSFYESKRHSEFNEQIMKEINESKGSCKKLFGEEKVFGNEFDLVKIVEFLSENNFEMIDEIEKVKGFVSHLIY